MIDRDFKRLVQIGAIELELQALERGAAFLAGHFVEPVSDVDLARRTAFCFAVGERALNRHASDDTPGSEN